MKDRRHKQSRPVGAMQPRTTKSAKPLRCGWCGRTVNNQAATLDNKRICKRCIKLARKEQGGTTNGTDKGASNRDQAGGTGEDTTVRAGQTESTAGADSARAWSDAYASIYADTGAGEDASEVEAP